MQEKLVYEVSAFRKQNRKWLIAGFGFVLLLLFITGTANLVTISWCLISVVVVFPIHWFSVRLNIIVERGRVYGPISWLGNKFDSYFLDRIDLDRFEKGERTWFEKVNHVFPLYSLDEDKPILILAYNVTQKETDLFFRELVKRIKEAKKVPS